MIGKTQDSFPNLIFPIPLHFRSTLQTTPHPNVRPRLSIALHVAVHVRPSPGLPSQRRQTRPIHRGNRFTGTFSYFSIIFSLVVRGRHEEPQNTPHTHCLTVLPHVPLMYFTFYPHSYPAMLAACLTPTLLFASCCAPCR